MKMCFRQAVDVVDKGNSIFLLICGLNKIIYLSKEFLKNSIFHKKMLIKFKKLPENQQLLKGKQPFFSP